MARKRNEPEEIVSKLRQVEVLQGQGMTRSTNKQSVFSRYLDFKFFRHTALVIPAAPKTIKLPYYGSV